MNLEIHPHQHIVSLQDRSRIKGHRPLVIWLTGLSGSGKSTIANALELRLVNEWHAHTYLLDGDNVRSGLNAGLGFSEEDRKENIRRVGEVAKLMYDAGLIVITAFISPFQSDRAMVRSVFEQGAFWEVFVSCSLETCMKLDPKNLYQKALAGEISEFTGITSPYEPPQTPEIEFNTDELSVEVCVQRILERMVKKQILKKINEENH
jgi:adenylyl-sulfate kinase